MPIAWVRKPFPKPDPQRSLDSMTCGATCAAGHFLFRSGIYDPGLCLIDPSHHHMLRISEIKLPLGHDEAALPVAIDAVLGTAPGTVRKFSIFKRSFDARKAQLLQVYIVDVTLADPATEAALFRKFA